METDRKVLKDARYSVGTEAFLPSSLNSAGYTGMCWACEKYTGSWEQKKKKSIIHKTCIKHTQSETSEILWWIITEIVQKGILPFHSNARYL